MARNKINGEKDRDDVKAVVQALEEADSAVEAIESRQSPTAAGDGRGPARSGRPRPSGVISRRLATAASRLRLPVNPGAGAFGSASVVVAVVVLSLLLGYATSAGVASPLLTAALFCLLVLAALFWAGFRANFPVQPAAEERGVHGRWRILLVASETPTIEQLHVLRTAVPRAILEVHAPILRSRGQCLTTDISREVELARQRLRTTLTRAGRAGIDASGEVGDPMDPVAGIEHQLRRHHVDEVVVATNPIAGGNQVESDLLRELRSQLHKPLTHVEIR
jgi:hypothetical protein